MKRATPSLARLEHVNDTLANAVDTAGDRSELFLAKVAFYLGVRAEDDTLFDEAVALALKDLED